MPPSQKPPTPSIPPPPSVLAVQNVKGGVGKTTIAVNLAALLAANHGKRVLLIDADPQCNASLYLLKEDRFAARAGEDASRDEGNLYDIFHGDLLYLDVVTGEFRGPVRKASNHEQKVWPPPEEGDKGSLTLVCASPQLFEVQEIAAEIVVSRIEDWLRAKDGAYDHVIIDCPPSISSLSLSALKAADNILVPMMADLFSVHGLPILLRSLEKYRKVLDIEAVIGGVVMSMYPPAAESAQRARAQQYVNEISKLCAAQEPAIRCLDAKISRDPAYPESFAVNLPLPFSTDPGHSTLVAELQAVATELGLTESVT